MTEPEQTARAMAHAAAERSGLDLEVRILTRALLCFLAIAAGATGQAHWPFVAAVVVVFGIGALCDAGGQR